jgi:hypothetical protein
MSRRMTALLVIVLALTLALSASPALAINPNPGVLPPNSHSHGMTYAEWGAAWWQWELKATIDANPALDTTGQFALLNQSGSVYFLAGTFGGAVERTVTIPTGKALFLPISNWVLTYPEDVPAGYDIPEAEKWMKDMLNQTFDGVKNEDLVCLVDGVAVQNPKMYRAQSEPFRLFLPPDCASVTTWYTLQDTNQTVHYTAGWHYPNISDGYWVMLAPLSAGKHTIVIKYGSYLNVIYHLTVDGGHK